MPSTKHSLLTAALGAVLAFTAVLPAFAGTKVLVAAIKSRELAPYNQAQEGFKQALREQGYDMTLLEYSLEKEEALRVLGDIRSKRPAVVLTLGTAATELAQKSVKDIPVVFTMVLNPVDNGFVTSMESPGGNMTGASMDISVRDQFSEIKAVVPKARRIGVLFNPKETGAVIEQAHGAAREMGLELVTRQVHSEKDVPKALEELGANIDVLWAVADSTVFGTQSSQFIILYTLRSMLPFMGISTSFVKAGALMAVFSDPEDIGKQSGEIAASILSGKRPGDIAVTVPRKTYLSLNLRIADQIKLKVPPEAAKKAREVIK